MLHSALLVATANGEARADDYLFTHAHRRGRDALKCSAVAHVSRWRAEFQRFQFSPLPGTAIIGPAQVQLYNSSLLTVLGKIFTFCLLAYSLSIDEQSSFQTQKKAVIEE